MTEVDSPERTSKFSFDVEKAANLLLILSNSMRIEIFKILIDQESDVNSLADSIGLTQSATSQHLAKMRDMKLVSSRKIAQQVFYTCCSEDVKQVLAIAGILGTKETLELECDRLEKNISHPVHTVHRSDLMSNEPADRAV